MSMVFNIKKIQPWLTAIQTIAVILGVAFAVIELGLKDREANRQRYTITVEVAAQDRSTEFQELRAKILGLVSRTWGPPIPGEGDPAYTPLLDELKQVTHGAKLLEDHYARLLYCAEQGLCDMALLRTLVCADVRGARLNLAMVSSWLETARDRDDTLVLAMYSGRLRPGWMLEHFNEICAIPAMWLPSRREMDMREKRYGPTKDLLEWPRKRPIESDSANDAKPATLAQPSAN